MPTITIDWTLSLTNLLTYLGVIVALAWRVGMRFQKFENDLAAQKLILNRHSEEIEKQDDRYSRAFERVSGLAEELQRLIGRSEFYFGTRKETNR